MSEKLDIRAQTSSLSPLSRLKKNPTQVVIRNVVYKKNISSSKLDPVKTSKTNFNAFGSPKIFSDARNLMMSRGNSEKIFRETTSSQFSTAIHRLSTNQMKRATLEPIEKKQATTGYSKSFKTGTTKGSYHEENSGDTITVAGFMEQQKQSRPITRQFGDETYAYYNSEEVINKPDRFEKFDQLADPHRFAKKYLFKKDLLIPDENEIRMENRLYFPQIIQDHENQNTVAAHFLGGTTHNIKHIELSIGVVEDEIENYKRMKEQIKAEMEVMTQKHEDELKEIFHKYMQDIKAYEEKMKDDFIVNQNEYFKYQKEITVLQRDKLLIEKEIYEHLKKITAVENQLFNFEAFDLQTDEKDLHNLSINNLRTEYQTTMSIKPTLH